MKELSSKLCAGCEYDGRWDQNVRCCDYFIRTGESRIFKNGEVYYDGKKYCDKYKERKRNGKQNKG